MAGQRARPQSRGRHHRFTDRFTQAYDASDSSALGHSDTTAATPSRARSAKTATRNQISPLAGTSFSSPKRRNSVLSWLGARRRMLRPASDPRCRTSEGGADVESRVGGRVPFEARPVNCSEAATSGDKRPASQPSRPTRTDSRTTQVARMRGRSLYEWSQFRIG
jgi:hypothetical protein